MTAARIQTHFWAKPIPVRTFDWSATFTDYDGEGPVGYGETEEQAIDDLLFGYPDELITRITDALALGEMDEDEARKQLKRAGLDPSEIDDHLRVGVGA